MRAHVLPERTKQMVVHESKLIAHYKEPLTRNLHRTHYTPQYFCCCSNSSLHDDEQHQGSLDHSYDFVTQILHNISTRNISTYNSHESAHPYHLTTFIFATATYSLQPKLEYPLCLNAHQKLRGSVYAESSIFHPQRIKL